MPPEEEVSWEGATLEVSHAPPIQNRERQRLAFLSLSLGFGQGCGLCFYVGAGGYFGDAFSNPRYFIYQCAFFYLPPIMVTTAAVVFDKSFDLTHGVRVTARFRIYLPGLVVTVLLAALCVVSGTSPTTYPGERWLVFGLGSFLGISAAILLSATCAMLGTVDAGMVPLAILGQTAAGLYTNVVARFIGFAPGCEQRSTILYWTNAAVSVAVSLLIFTCFDTLGVLEKSFRYHERLLAMRSHGNDDRVSSTAEDQDVAAGAQPQDLRALVGSSAFPALRGGSIRGMWRRRTGPPPHNRQFLSLPGMCWSMAICQALAIAMNMSLTPLANQIARGSYQLTQTLVLTKLLSDFVGRTVFLMIPRPTPRTMSSPILRSLRGHALLVWLVEAIRLPFWIAVYSRSIGSSGTASWTDFLSHEDMLLWVVWLPLISLGALSSSWCCVVALSAAAPDKRTVVNLLMTSSIYAGYFVGISIAMLSVR